MPAQFRIAVVTFALLLISLSGAAVTYLVPPDRAMVQVADDIVVVTALSSRSVATPGGGVVTIADLRVEEGIKGPFVEGDTLSVSEMGGSFGGVVQFVPGSPRYREGQRYLVMTTTAMDGTKSTWGFGLGQFRFLSDSHLNLLVRSVDYGFDSATEDIHCERARDARRFLRYVKALANQTVAVSEDYFVDLPEADGLPVKSDAAFSASSYLIFDTDFGAIPRWASPVYSFRTARVAQAPTGTSGTAAVTAALSVWSNDSGSNVALSSLSNDDTLTGGTRTPDGKNTILFGDPNNELGADGIYGLAVITAITGSTHDFQNETFVSIKEADVVIAKSFGNASVQACLNAIVAHEVGHTLGLRHSNENQTMDGPCTGSGLNCSGNGTAIMSADTQCFTPTSLQSWDQSAVRAVYPNPGACTSPAITTHPQNKTIASGTSASLTVGASGTTPVTYQWFVGNSGNTTTTAGSGASLTVTPAATTNYWARASNGCGTADSTTATVTVTACGPPVINAQPVSQTVTKGTTALLDVSFSGTSPMTVTWYEGVPPDKSKQVSTGANTVSPPVNADTNFWAFLQNACGTASTNPAHVTVAVPCVPPAITTATATPSSVTTGDPVTLSVAATGSSLSYQWFQGLSGDVSHPLTGGDLATVITTPQGTGNYWVRVSSGCGAAAANSATIPVTVTPPCQPQLVQPDDRAVFPGSAIVLTVVASGGTPLHYAWYQGLKGDTSLPFGTDSASVSSGIINADTPYFVTVTNSCGSITSDTIMVRVFKPKHRATGH